MASEFNGEVLRARTVTLDVTMHRPGCTRRTRVGLDSQANPNWTRTNKTIFKSEAYHRACRVQDRAYNYLDSISIPSPLVGYFTIKVESLAEVYDELDRYDAELREAVAEFCDEYEAAKERAKEELRDLYREADYPTAEHYRSGLWIERKVIELGTPSAEKVGSVIAEAEIAKARRFWDDAAREAVCGLREAFVEVVDHLAEQLEPNPDGSKRRLTDAAVRNVREFIELFDKRDAMGDAELRAMVDKAKAIMSGKTADGLRDNAFFRDRVAKGMGEVKRAVSAMLVDAPRRRIRFGGAKGDGTAA